jgi:GNAT superfamily N-acetyltransferase
MARDSDADAIFDLASAMASSFTPTRLVFQESIAKLLTDRNAVVLVVEDEERSVSGYLLGFAHLAFFANGVVAWIEEIAVRSERRRQGLGRALVDEFEEWSRTRHARLVALATRRADAFYGALGYERSAVYFRKGLAP